jgi:hypothetical protein
MDMMFDGKTITLKADMTYTANLMGELNGDWLLREDTLILNSEKTPTPIVLTELSIDSCFWAFSKRSRIPFFKDNGTISANANSDFVEVDLKELQGEWRNTNVEDPNRTKRQNTFLFGDSVMDEKLILEESNNFVMPKSSIRMKTKKMAKGSWSVDGGIMTFQFESGEKEQLGIVKFTKDSLVLLDLEERLVPMVDKSKIQFTYTKELASGLRKYLIKADVLDTLYTRKRDLSIALMVPEGFGDLLYDQAGRTVASFIFTSCKTCANPEEERVNFIKETAKNKDQFIWFIDNPEEGFFMYQRKANMTNSDHYELNNVFSYKGKVYEITVTSFLEENVDVLRKSIENMTIVED